MTLVFCRSVMSLPGLRFTASSKSTASRRVVGHHRDDFFYVAVRVVPELNAKGEIVVLTGHLAWIEQKKNKGNFAFRMSVFIRLQPGGPLWCSYESAGWPLYSRG
jgi:hypothetical protein